MSDQGRSTLLAFPEDVHAELGLSLISSRRYISGGRLGPHIKVGRRIAVPRSALNEYIKRKLLEAQAQAE